MSDKTEKMIKRELKVKLSEKEINERRDLAASNQHTLNVTNKELDELTKNYKEEKSEKDRVIEECEKSISQALTEIDERKATMLVECKEVMNYERGAVEYWYGGELNEERAMEGDEHQRSLFEKEAGSLAADGSEMGQ